MSLKQKETKFKPRMKLNHNIYKNSLNKFCSQKDFVSRVIHSCVSSWFFFRVYKEIRKELNKSEPTLSYVFIRNHFFKTQLDFSILERASYHFSNCWSLLKKLFTAKHRNFFLFSNCQVRTLQTTKAGNKRIKLLRLLVGRAIDHTHWEKKKAVHGSQWPNHSSHMRKNHCWLSWFFWSV